MNVLTSSCRHATVVALFLTLLTIWATKLEAVHASSQSAAPSSSSRATATSYRPFFAGHVCRTLLPTETDRSIMQDQHYVQQQHAPPIAHPAYVQRKMAVTAHDDTFVPEQDEELAFLQTTVYPLSSIRVPIAWQGDSQSTGIREAQEQSIDQTLALQRSPTPATRETPIAFWKQPRIKVLAMLMFF